MGIRIHKVMGWGLRWHYSFNPSPLIEDGDDYDISEAFQSYVNDLSSGHFKDDLAHSIIKHRGMGDGHEYTRFALGIRPDDDYYDHVNIIDVEGDAYSGIVFSCGQKDWRRFDSTMDYYEWHHGSNERNPADYETQWQYFEKSCGIFPYLGMELIRGRDLVPGAKMKYRPAEYNQLVGHWDDSGPQADGELLESLRKDYRPVIPMQIYGLVMNLPIFRDWKKSIELLHPMMVTYWS